MNQNKLPDHIEKEFNEFWFQGNDGETEKALIEPEDDAYYQLKQFLADKLADEFKRGANSYKAAYQNGFKDGGEEVSLEIYKEMLHNYDNYETSIDPTIGDSPKAFNAFKFMEWFEKIILSKYANV